MKLFATSKEREVGTISTATELSGSIPIGEIGPTFPKEVLSTDRKEIILRFKVPRGRISEIMRAMNYLQTKFQSLEIEIKATDGHNSNANKSPIPLHVRGFRNSVKY